MLQAHLDLLDQQVHLVKMVHLAFKGVRVLMDNQVHLAQLDSLDQLDQLDSRDHQDL